MNLYWKTSTYTRRIFSTILFGGGGGVVRQDMGDKMVSLIMEANSIRYRRSQIYSKIRRYLHTYIFLYFNFIRIHIYLVRSQQQQNKFVDCEVFSEIIQYINYLSSNHYTTCQIHITAAAFVRNIFQQKFQEWQFITSLH